MQYYDLEQKGLYSDQEYENRFIGYDYKLRECKNCHAITEFLSPDEGLVLEIYDAWISSAPRRFSFSEYMHSLREAMLVTTFLLRHHGKICPSDLKVMDYGLGYGRFAMAMKACGCQVHGFDVSPVRKESARANGITIVEPGDIPGQGYDFINTEQVFEHLPEPKRTAELMVTGLGSRGVLKISVPYARWAEVGPNRIDWHARNARNSWMLISPLEHLNYFKRPSLEIMAGQLGLEQVRFRVLDEIKYTFGWGGPRKIAKNLARPFVRQWFRNYYLFARME